MDLIAIADFAAGNDVLVIAFDHPWSGVVYNSGRVCMYVCLSDDNFRKPWRRRFIFAHAAYLYALRVKFIYEGHWIKGKVTGAKKVENSYSRVCKTSIGSNSSSIKRLLGMAAQMVWPPSLSHDRKWPRITKCMHLWVCRLRLENNLVLKNVIFWLTYYNSMPWMLEWRWVSMWTSVSTYVYAFTLTRMSSFWLLYDAGILSKMCDNYFTVTVDAAAAAANIGWHNTNLSLIHIWRCRRRG